MKGRLEHSSSESLIYQNSPLKDSKAENISIFVLIPGNPGLVEFYITYLDLIQQSFKDFEILALGHAGYEPPNGPFNSYSLDFQIEDKVEKLKSKINNCEKHVDIYFLSHSVGSYITQRIVEKLINDKKFRDQADIKFIGLICPTIYDIAKSDSGRRFVALLTHIPIVAITLYLISFLNLILTDSTAKWIIRHFFIAKPKLQDETSLSSWENSVQGAFKIYKSPTIVEQTLTLASEEMTCINLDDTINDWFFKEFPVKNQTKVWAFFANEDYWVHKSTRDHLLKLYHNLNVPNLYFDVGDIHDGIGHSFCVDQSVEFSEITVRTLKSLFPDLASEQP